MRTWLVSHLVLLLIIANGTPVLLGLVLGPRWNRPVDNNHLLPDNRPLLGPSKTLRGLFSAIIVTGLLAPQLRPAGDDRGPLLQLHQAASRLCIQSLRTSARSNTRSRPAALGHANGARFKRK